MSSPGSGGPSPEPASPPAEAGSDLARTSLALLLGVAGVATFAATLPATRVAVTGLDASFVAVGRAVLAGALAAILLVARRVPWPRRSDLGTLFVIALCLVFGFPVFTALAMERVPASHGAVVLAIMPLCTALAAALVGGERPGALFLALSAVGAGIVLVFSLSDSGWTLIAGDVYLVAAAASAALGYALAGRLSRRVPGWAVISWGLVLVLPLTLAASVASAPAVWPRGTDVWLAFAYLGVFSMYLGFFFWNTALAMGGIAKIGQIQLLQPFFTILIATAVTGEPLEWRFVVFAASIVVIVAAAQRAKVVRR